MRTLTSAQIETMQYRRGKFSFAVTLQVRGVSWTDTGAIAEKDVFEYTFDKDGLMIVLKDSASIGTLLSNYALQLARIYITETITDGATVISEPSPIYFPYSVQWMPQQRLRILASALPFQAVAGIEPTDTVEDIITALGTSRDITPEFISGQEWYTYPWGMPGPTVTISLGELARNLGKRYMVEAFAREADVLFQNRYNSPNRIVDYTPFTTDIEFYNTTAYNAPIGGISWTDDDGVLNESTGATQPIHHLGYIPSSATGSIMDLIDTVLLASFKFKQWPDLRLENGDYLRVTDPVSTTHAGMVNVTHTLKKTRTGAITWEQTVEAVQMPSTVSPSFKPNRFTGAQASPINHELDTTNFSGNLGPQDQTVQAAVEALMRGQREKLTAARTIYVRGPQTTVTMTIASPCVVTWTSHTLKNGDRVVFTTSGALPTGVTAGTEYYVVNSAANTFQISATEGGAAINSSGVQSGTHKCSTGNDQGDGLTTEYGRALLTIQEAVNRAAMLDTSIYNVTIQLSDSKYNASSVSLKNPLGAGEVTIKGNATTPANVVCDLGFVKSVPGTTYNLTYMQMKKVSTSATFAITVSTTAYIDVINIDFSTGWTAHMGIFAHATISVAGNYTISGGANYHLYIAQQGFFNASGTFTITLTGTPAFSSYFIFCGTVAQAYVNSASVTWSGGATGTRYRSELNSAINTAGGGANYFPGNAAGSTGTGGQYA